MKKTSRKINKFTSKMQKKLVILFVLVLLAFVGLSVRLILINKDNGEKYKKQVLSQQQYDSKTIPYKRGDIVDAKGTPIAMSEKVYNLVLDVKLVLEKEAYLEPTIQAVSKNFDVKESELRNYITANPTSQYYVLQKQLTYDEISPFVELENDPEKGGNINGIWFEEEYRRVYPYKTLASDVIGFTGKDNVGSYGLEEYYNDVLNGTNGREYGYLNDDSTLERTTKAAVDGNTIVTSIDVNIQSIVEQKILEFNEAHRNEARDGAGSANTGVIIMDPNSGEVKAMASYPAFDLNDPKNPDALKQEYTDDAIKEMTDDEKMEALNAIWKNFCISSTFEPGSTAKPFTLATGIEAGMLTGNETYTCNGSLEIGDHVIHCHNRLGDGAITSKQAIEKSCNVALMHMASAIGTDTFMKYNKVFNFGLKTNIDLAGEARTDSVVFDKDKMVPTDLAISSFGQGYNVTMIQQAAGFCSLINGGYYYEPHVINKVTSQDGATVQNIEPRVLKQTISSTTSDIIRDFCNGVVTEGTGVTARPAGYTMGGKTGTAEKYPRGTGKYVVSFMGYVPADDPQVLIYVVIDEPNVASQDNARFATLLTKAIMKEVLPYMNIFQTEPLTDGEIKEQAEEDALKTSQSVSENSVSGNAVTDTNADGTTHTVDNNGTDTTSKETGAEEEQEEKKVEIDPETGYAIDPVTGDLLDPETGAAIDPNASLIE
ncbi:MAG: penicillin-binding transpeptidase domain-containing protein [Lachnospiraceae bacterium]|nr:penicillin-binding transpeptidase domain-containing protein [Lachnospiraceae bacterium]